MDISSFSPRYTVRCLTEEDVPAVFALCSRNPQFYRFCPPFVTEDGIRQDMKALPPRKTADDKYYVGYYDEERLIAVLDLITGFPDEKTAFIGFFMVEHDVQGHGVGGGIVEELCRYLRETGFRAIRLGWVQGNPQAAHFWSKCGFRETGVLSKTEQYTIMIAEKQLTGENDLRND